MTDGWSFTPGPNFMEQIRSAAVTALQETAEEIGSASDEYAPYDTGKLIDSRRVKVDPATLTAAVGYLDQKAVAAHENVHDHYKHGRRAKFLEAAVNEHREALTENFATQVRRVLR